MFHLLFCWWWHEHMLFAFDCYGLVDQNFIFFIFFKIKYSSWKFSPMVIWVGKCKDASHTSECGAKQLDSSSSSAIQYISPISARSYFPLKRTNPSPNGFYYSPSMYGSNLVPEALSHSFLSCIFVMVSSLAKDDHTPSFSQIIKHGKPTTIIRQQSPFRFLLLNVVV